MQALTIGAVGVVPALGNIAPRAVVEIQRLYEKGEIQKASELQLQLIEPDDALARWYGNPGIKGGMQKVLGWGGKPRNPLRLPKPEQLDAIANAVGAAMTAEQSLTKS